MRPEVPRRPGTDRARIGTSGVPSAAPSPQPADERCISVARRVRAPAYPVRMRHPSSSRLVVVAALGVGAIVLTVVGVLTSARLAAEHQHIDRRTLKDELREEARTAVDRLKTLLGSLRDAPVPDDALPHIVVTMRYVANTNTRPPSPFRPAEEAEFVHRDLPGALATYRRVLDDHGLDPSWRAEGLRNVARLERAHGEPEHAQRAIEDALRVEGADDTAALLVAYDAARFATEDEARNRLRHALAEGAYAAAPPAVRRQLLLRLGARPSDAPALQALTTALDLSSPADALIPLSDGRVAWALGEDDGTYRFAIASLDDVLGATLPGVAAGRWTRVAANGLPLPHPPFPDTQLAFTPVTEAAIDRRASGQRWMVLAPVLVVAAVLALGALALHRDERRRRTLDERREAFLLSATHELKTPIANVRLYAETLTAHGTQDPNATVRFARIIDAEARRLERRVQEMLVVAAGRDAHTSMKTAFEPLPLVRQITEIWKDRPGVPPLRLETSIKERTRARGTPALFTGAIEAVLDNAAKFAPAEIVTVRVGCDAHHVTVDVEDRGPGIPPGDRERVFEPFARLARDVAAARPGTGLGLALARRSARACGGDVVAEEGPFGGARVRVLFQRVSEREEDHPCPVS